MQWRVNVILSMMSASPEIYSGGASIHAPVKSATYVGKPAFRKPDGFNPRAREERDLDGRLWDEVPACFNPRAREERDSASPRPSIPG